MPLGRAERAPTIALLGDLTFLHDVSGLVNLPDVPCTFVVLDNGGGGIFSFLPQATSVEPALFEQLFGTPPTSDIARGRRADSAFRCTRSRTAATRVGLAAPGAAPSLVLVKVPGRAENVALHEAINQAVRLALALRLGDGVEVDRLPVGLWKVSSTLAFPDIFQPISCTQR